MKIVGGIIIAIGILIAGASGLCSLVLLADGGTWTGPSAAESLSIIALVGGLPFVFGVALVLIGRYIIRSQQG